MSDLSITIKQTGGGDYGWLRSRHGRDNAIPATIQRSLLTAGTHYNAQGVIPSGLALGKLTGQDLYGPFDPTATDGRQYLAGFVLEPIQLEYDFTGVTSVTVSVPMVVHGIINPTKIPNTPVLTTATKTTGSFVFTGVDYTEEA